MASSAPAVKAYLYGTLLPSLYPTAQVVYGSLAPRVVGGNTAAVAGVRANLDPGPMRSPRQQDENLQVTILLSCDRVGIDDAAQVEATEAVYGLLDALHDHLKVNANLTLGGTCRHAEITSHDLDESTDPDVTERVRNATLTVTLSVLARI